MNGAAVLFLALGMVVMSDPELIPVSFQALDSCRSSSRTVALQVLLDRRLKWDYDSWARTYARKLTLATQQLFGNCDHGSLFFGIEFVGPVGGLYEFATASK